MSDSDHVAGAKVLRRNGSVWSTGALPDDLVPASLFVDCDAARASTSTVLTGRWRDGRRARPWDVLSDIARLTHALKRTTLSEAVARLAERALLDSWTHEEFRAAGC